MDAQNSLHLPEGSLDPVLLLGSQPSSRGRLSAAPPGPQPLSSVPALVLSGSAMAQGLTTTPSLNVLETWAGLKALARKKSTSKVPGFLGVKKNSRVGGPLAEGS